MTLARARAGLHETQQYHEYVQRPGVVPSTPACWWSRPVPKASAKKGNLNMCVVENVRDQKWKAKCAQACAKSDPKKKSRKKDNLFCDTKALIEVSNRIRPTSDNTNTNN